MAAPAAAIPTATPRTECRCDLCIRDVFVILDPASASLWVEFSLVDSSGRVPARNPPQLYGDLTVALYRPADNKYLIGASVPETAYTGYAGDDVP